MVHDKLCHDVCNTKGAFGEIPGAMSGHKQNIKISMGLGHWNAPTGSANQEMMMTTTFVTDVMTKIS